MAQLSMRLDDELRDAFAKLAEEHKLSQPQMFGALMESFSKEALKQAVPDAAGELDEFDATLHKALDMYRASVQRASDAYDVAKDKVRRELEQLAALVEENRELRETDKARRAEVEALRKQVASLTQERDEANAKVEQLTANLQASRDALTEAKTTKYDSIMEDLMRVLKEHTKEDSE